MIRGNHHDAWVNGAEDPISGQAPMLEEARMLGELHKQGWTPKRTIIYCAWDGEEPGLLGSAEWVETHVEELQKHAVAYINSDGNERGFLTPAARRICRASVSAVARDIKDPEKNMSVFRARPPARHRAGERCGRARRDSQTQRSSRQRARRRIGLHRVSGFRRHFHA